MTDDLTQVGIEADRIDERDAPEPDDFPGREDGAGTFGEGEIRVERGRMVVEGASTDGWRIGTVVDTVIFEGEDISPGSGRAPEVLDVEGYDYRLGEGELHLRRSSQ